MVSVARRLARVVISSASICEWVPYDIEQIISFQMSMSICVGSLDSDEFLVIGCNFIMSYVFKDDPFCFCFRLINYGRLFQFHCFWVLFFQLLFDVCGDVMFSISDPGMIHKSKALVHLSF